jgi:porphobilinogen synthase
MDNLFRPRRLRKNKIVRDMIAETTLSRDQFVMPYFIIDGKNKSETITTMPGIERQTTDVFIKQLESDLATGINKVLLFGVTEEKDEKGTSAFRKDNLIARTIKEIRMAFGDQVYVITDVCLCAYMSHGHCGVLHHGEIVNDETLPILSSMALSHADAGVDMVAPSDMMDGRVMAIRETLDENGFTQTALMSYSIKFSSSYYGPFREAAHSAPASGDRKSYQMDFRNGRETMIEALLDEEEGADVLMVKPGMAYLDIVRDLRMHTQLPIAVYNVSGEFSMVKFAAQHGAVDEQAIVMENMYAMTRAGARILITYHTRDIFKNKWL